MRTEGSSRAALEPGDDLPGYPRDERGGRQPAALRPTMTLIWIKCSNGVTFGSETKARPPDRSCCERWGTVISGQMNLVTHDGSSVTYEAGEAFHLLPGSLPTFPEDCSWYEFTPNHQVERLFTHMGLARGHNRRTSG